MDLPARLNDELDWVSRIENCLVTIRIKCMPNHHIDRPSFLTIRYRELHSAPLYNSQAILCLGTGTALWAVDIAEIKPQALPRWILIPATALFRTGLRRALLDHLNPGGYSEVFGFAIWACSGDGSLEDDSPWVLKRPSAGMGESEIPLCPRR